MAEHPAGVRRGGQFEFQRGGPGVHSTEADRGVEAAAACQVRRAPTGGRGRAVLGWGRHSSRHSPSGRVYGSLTEPWNIFLNGREIQFSVSVRVFISKEKVPFSFQWSNNMYIVFTVAWQKEMLILKPFLRTGEQDWREEKWLPTHSFKLKRIFLFVCFMFRVLPSFQHCQRNCKR